MPHKAMGWIGKHGRFSPGGPYARSVRKEEPAIVLPDAPYRGLSQRFAPHEAAARISTRTSLSGLPHRQGFSGVGFRDPLVELHAARKLQGIMAAPARLAATA